MRCDEINGGVDVGGAECNACMFVRECVMRDNWLKGQTGKAQIGAYLVWNIKRNRPATGMELYELDSLNKLKVRFVMDNDDGIVWPELDHTVVTFEIRKV